MTTATAEAPTKKIKTNKMPPAKGDLPLEIEVPDTALGRAGFRMREAQEVFEKAAKELGEAKTELTKAMASAKRYSIQVRGYKFNRTHTGPKDGIKVEKVK